MSLHRALSRFAWYRRPFMEAVEALVRDNASLRLTLREIANVANTARPSDQMSSNIYTLATWHLAQNKPPRLATRPCCCGAGNEMDCICW